MEGKQKKPYLDIDLSFDKRILFIGLLIIFTISLVESGGFDSLSIGGGSGGMQAPQFAIAPVQEYRGTLNVEIKHIDGLDNTEIRKETTDLVTTYYKQRNNGEFVIMGQGDNSMLHIDNNKIYFTVVPVRPDLFIAPSQMADSSLNPRILNFDYVDINKDGIYEWVFQADVTNLPNMMMGQPYPTIQFFTASYDKGEMSLNSPSDIEVSLYNAHTSIEWEVNVREETVVPLTKVEVILHTSDTTLFSERGSYVIIPYYDNLEFQEMTRQILSNKIIYFFDMGGDLGGADYITTGRNDNPDHDMRVRIQTHLQVDDELPIELRLTTITPEETFDILSDTVKLFPTESNQVQDVIYNTENCSIKDIRSEIAQVPFSIKVYHDSTRNSVFDYKHQGESFPTTHTTENKMEFFTDGVDSYEIFMEINYDEPELRELMIEYVSDGIVVFNQNERFNSDKYCILFFVETEQDKIPSKEEILVELMDLTWKTVEFQTNNTYKLNITEP